MTPSTQVSPYELPLGWRVGRIGDHFEIQLGKMLSPRARRGDAPRPYLRNANVQWGRFALDDLLEMDFDERESAKFRLVPGDILVCEGGEPGRTAIWQGQIRDCFYQKALHRLRPRTGLIDPEFFAFWMEAAVRILRINFAVGVKTTIAHLPAARLAESSIAFPPVIEQRAIARAAEQSKRRLEAERRRLVALRELKAATMAKLFREGLRGERLKQTEIGEIPESWRPRPAIELANLSSGGTPSKQRPEWWSGTVPWLSPKDMKRSWLADTQDHISEEAAEMGSRVVPAGTVFVVVRGMILAKGIPVCASHCPMAFNQDVKALAPKKGVNPAFLLYAVQASTERLRKEIGTSAHGTRRLGSTAVETLPLPVPDSADDAREIGRVLRSLDEQVERSRSRAESLRALFNSTLFSLMTGTLRLPEFRDA